MLAHPSASAPTARPSPDHPAAGSVGHHLPHNVPAALSEFVGRGRELAEVGALLGCARLLTLAGPGGVGKTRLARECAARAAGAGHADLADGVWWVELAPLAAGADPAPAVAAALGVRPPAGAEQAGALAEALAAALAGRPGAPRRLLVVLDNCEHVVEGAAALADRLLRRCPGLTLLATSREALGVEGEVVWPVGGLSHPPRPDRDAAARPGAAPESDVGGSGRALAELAGYEAVALFVERARAVQPGFALTARTAPAVAAITSRLDGLPLALELAAAQVGTLGVDQLAARLDDVFAVLARGRRAVLPRHRTLRALLDWSYHLLAPDERDLLARLSVFRGPFPIEAVETLSRDGLAGRGEPDASGVLAALGRLAEQSLVDVREHDGETRYRLLETVRQYGLARLAESPAVARRVRARHAAWVAAFTAASVPLAWSAARGRTVARLARDVDEIRAALEWAAGAGGDPITGVRIAGALAWFWYSGVPWGEARARTAAALAAADAQGVPDAARTPDEQAAIAALLYPMSGLAYFAGEPARMLALGDRARALWGSVADAAAADPSLGRELGAALVHGRTITAEQTGQARAALGEFPRALADLDEAVAAARDGSAAWLHAVMLMRRALVAAAGGQLDQAMADYDASVPRLRAVGETWFLSLALEGMAVVSLIRGDLGAAAAHARESAAVLRGEPDPWFISRSLDTLAAVAVADAAAPAAVAVERARTAARLMGAAATLRARCGAEVIAPDRARYAATEAAARAALGADFAAPWDEGAALDLAGALALAAESDVVPASGAARAARPAPGPAESVVASPARAAAAAPSAVQVLAFGPLAVERDGVVVPPSELTPAKVRELLLYLALHPPRSKEQIALALWPDAAPARVRNAFHVTLHQLRRALGVKDAVAFDDGAYALARPAADGAVAGDGGARPLVACDVDAVLAAAAAVRAADRAAEHGGVRGADGLAAVGATPDALAGWGRALDRVHRGALGEGENVGEWIAAPRARVGAAWADGMEALARLHARAGAPGEAAAVLEALVAAEPLREGAHRALMACYVGAGEPARALAHYDALVALLAREVGAAPGRETRAVADAIRQGARPS